ncbi:LysM peptidoglycan-binding domain-containing protein [Stappia sp. F7233]|uniref:LysM peptidoglycan-binding domain-containing protein n=1 Tax=Stappia albiluteola TaxID=2758565 RepID=A0A839AI40_9HYPH|nr:LysM peptidoglycan-binding domain-containing protein [Stappia albiluteola]MBA5779383.1 LysM peptidoglycan-binding domain-containing protein [Stappia albiluteola]
MTKKGLGRLVGAAAVVGLIVLALAFYERSQEAKAPGDAAPSTAQVEPKSGPDQQPAPEVNQPEQSAPSQTTVAEKSTDTNTAADRIQPTFDIFRVEPTGDAVVAGRSEAGAIIALLANGEVVGKGIANESGEFAIVLEKPLAPGTHDVTIEAKVGDAEPVISNESIAVSVPESGQGEVLVVLNKPGEATEVLQKPEEVATAAPAEPKPEETVVAAAEPQRPSEPEAPTPAPATSQPAPQPVAETPAADPSAPVAAEPVEPVKTEEQKVASAPATAEPAPAQAPETTATDTTPAGEAADAASITVDAVETEKDKVFVAGASEANKEVRVYVDNELIGKTKSDDKGRWLLETNKAIEPGSVNVRADQVEGEEGKVAGRAEVTFEKVAEAVQLRPVSVTATGSGTQGATAEAEDAAIPNVIIRRGDNLWTISRRLYGHGIRYTTIYQANQGQIRNPDLIYPGQVFVLPIRDENWEKTAN